MKDVFNYSEPSEYSRLYDCKKLPDEYIAVLDIQPSDLVRIKSYCGFLPTFHPSFAYDEKCVYKVKEVGINVGNMIIYTVEDNNGCKSRIPHCYLELVQKGNKPRFVIDSSSDPNGIIIRDGATSKAILHANKNSAANARIDVTSLMTSLCEMLNTSTQGIMCNLQANPSICNTQANQQSK